MLRSILTKTIHEKRFSLLAWSIAIVAMTILTLVLYPNFSQNGFEDVIKSLPESLKPLVGSIESFKTIPGYIAQQIYGPQIPIFLIIMAIVYGISIGVGEEDSKVLQTLLSRPVSRTRIYNEKATALLISSTIASLAVALGVVVSLRIIDEQYSVATLAIVTLACVIMTFGYGILAFASGMATGKKGLSTGVASGYAFLCFMLASLAPAVKVLQPFEKISLFYYFNSPNPAAGATNWWHIGILLLACVVLYILGLIGFTKRDIS